jgi:predicted permease
MSKFIYSFAIVFTGLLLGYAIQILVGRKHIAFGITNDDLRKLLQKTALLFVNPVAILGAVWIVNLKNATLIALPFIGLFTYLIGGALAVGAARLLDLEGQKTGALFGCGFFTNIGAIGTLICYIFLGEAGFALVAIFKLFQEVAYYGIGFPIAKYFSSSRHDVPARGLLKHLVRDPYLIMAVAAITIGGLLNISNVPRPEFYKTIISMFVPLLTLLLLTSIGLAMKFRKISVYLRECLSISLIKFVLVPVLVFLPAYFLGYGSIQNGLPLKVVLILSSMPVAFNALIPPSIYNLDLDLANSCWFFTTAMLVVVLPVLMMIVDTI